MDKMLDLTQPTPANLIHERNGFDLSFVLPVFTPLFEITKPLPDPSILLTGGCHVDHEGYDLNEIEQAYYTNQGVSLVKDPTWYKDGGGERITTAILQPWIKQLNELTFGEDQLILDHSHFVYKFPIRGEAEQQVRQYAKQRPELLRLVSTNYKCGLDVCIDLLDGDENGSIQPIVHIEWDYEDFEDMYRDAVTISNTLKFRSWHVLIPMIKGYNRAARKYKDDAFKQADFRAQHIFGDKAYRLIPTL